MEGELEAGAQMLTLREAVARYHMAPGSTRNAYDWYRKQAHNSNTVSLGGTTVPVRKRGRTWVLDEVALEEALQVHRAHIAILAQVTMDYAGHMLHGGDGETVATEFGGYKRRGAFHYVWSSEARSRQISDGTWVCSLCWRPSRLLHEKDECHRCRDWSPCGSDCTLSQVACPDCNKVLSI
jgi:hypothetical protein